MYQTARAAEPWHLMRKVLLLFLLVVTLSLGLVYLLQSAPKTPGTMFDLLADGSIGAAMGFGSRVVLRRRHWMIRALVAAALSIVGLVLLGFLTDARSGVGPLELELRRVSWLEGAGIAWRVPSLPGNSPTNLLDVANTVVTVSMSWIALRAWGGRTRTRATRRESLSVPRAGAQPIARPSAELATASSGLVVRPKTGSRHLTVLRGTRNGRVVVARSARIRRIGRAGRRRGLLQRRAPVQLAAFEEHRCPYCLQVIKRGDSRVECPVCHTLHHKDCWDITGTCQVPHLNG